MVANTFTDKSYVFVHGIGQFTIVIEDEKSPLPALKMENRNSVVNADKHLSANITKHNINKHTIQS